MNYYTRTLEARITEALSIMPVVFVNGPRQAGKSTLVQHIVSKLGFDADYVTLDDITTYASAENDPEGFLRRFTKPVIIDEVQRVPELFRVLKLLVDEYRIRDKAHANGRFLLTGSANILALPGLSDALVGRMAILSLYPLSASEVFGQGKPVINGWFDQEIGFEKNTDTKHNKHLFDDVIHHATFPEITQSDRKASVVWFDGYLTTSLQHDVRQLAEIDKIAALPNIVKVLAARTGGLLNDADCARDAKLNTVTYRRYRLMIQQLFLISLVPPWYRNIGKRLVKSPKLFFTDTAMLCHLLGTEASSLQQQNPGLFGHIFENFVASELTKQLATLSDATLYHFRTHDNKEVDFVIERRNGTLLGIEVKARDSITERDFLGLKLLKEQIGKDFARGIVLYMGKDTIPFGDDMVAMPLDNLWRFNMEVTTDRDIRTMQSLDGYIFWAKYGERTRLRCFISRETIDDYFHNNASEVQSLAAIHRHWHAIWPIFVRKMTAGQIEIIRHDNGVEYIQGRYQDIKQVTLEPRDFGNTDFRDAT